MEYRIVIDSCGELTEEMERLEHIVSVPLHLHVDEEVIVDDNTFRQEGFLGKLAVCRKCPKSSCPSPAAYMQAYWGSETRIYVVTLSSELSGSYNSAKLGVKLYQEEASEARQIHVFDSKSASVAETLIVRKIIDCEKKGMEFAQVVETVETYIEQQHTFFVLESLEMLRKNGRLTGMKAMMATMLNIKPIMGSTAQGTICQLGQERGVNKALGKLVKIIAEIEKNSRGKILAISHCNCYQRAMQVKELLSKLLEPQEILILNTRGVSSLYAGDGGIIVVV